MSGSRARRHAPVAAFLCAAAACGTGHETTPSPYVLAYAAPQEGALTYAFEDSTTFSIDTGEMGAMEPVATLAGTAELVLGGDTSGLIASLRFPRLRGSFDNPGQGTRLVTGQDVRGAFRLAVSRRGGVTVIDSPSLTAAFNDVSGPETLPRLFFVSLPGRPVTPGDRWVDTVVVREGASGTTSEIRREVETTFVGDTVAGGRPLLRLGTRSRMEVDITGTSGGVEIRERLTGVISGAALWDRDRALLVERTEDGHLHGTLEIRTPGAPPLPVTARVHRLVRLLPE